MRIAVITGASGGLGRVYARHVDKVEKNIDEIWLIARRKEKLEETASMLEHKSRVMPLDLIKPESIDELEHALDASGASVGLFINCAGFAKIGNYEKVSRSDGDAMIELNCRAAVDMVLAVLPYMQSGDRIMELCSSSSFQPLQHMSIYSASKTFLYRYTRALRMELLPRGIIVTAVCPWWVKGTEFFSVARDNPANPDTSAAVKGFPVAQNPEKVVGRSLRDSRIGLAVSTPGIMCFLHRIFTKIIPNKWMLYFWEFFRRLG